MADLPPEPQETQAIIAYGTLLQFGSLASPPVWTTLAEVTNISGPGMSRTTPEATHMQSPGGWIEKIAGLKDPGQISVDCNYLPNSESQGPVTGVARLFKTGEKRPWRLVFPYSPPLPWGMGSCIISAFEPDMPVDDRMTLSITLDLAGEPDYMADA